MQGSSNSSNSSTSSTSSSHMHGHVNAAEAAHSSYATTTHTSLGVRPKGTHVHRTRQRKMPGTGKRRPQRTLFLMMAVALFVSLSIVVVSFIMNQSASWHKDHTQLGAMVPCVANNTRYLCIPRGSAPVRGEPVPRRDGTAQQQQHAREHAREHARAAHDAVSVNNAHNRGRAHVHDDSVHPADADSEATAASTQAAGTNAFVEGTASWSEDDDGWQLLPATASPARTSDADADRADVPGRSPCGSKGMATVDKVECSAEWSVCCPGGPGGHMCSEQDCPSLPCAGHFMKVHCAKTCGMCNTDSHAPELEVGVTTTTTVTTVTSPPSPLTAAASKGTKGVRVSFASRCDASGVRADQQPDACPEPYVCVHTQEGPVCVCRNGQSCSLPAAGRATVTVPPVTATLMTTQAVVLPERPDTRRPSALVDGGCAGLETPCTTGFVCVSAAEVGPVCLCKSGQDTVCSNYHSAQAKARLAIAHTGAKAEQDQQQDQQAEAAPAPPETDAAAEGSRADSAVECTDNLKEGWCMVEWMSCCPGGQGGLQCSSNDCDPERAPGLPCAGKWMADNCAATCGICKIDPVDTAMLRDEVRAASQGWHDAIVKQVVPILPHVSRHDVKGNPIIMTTVSMGYLDFFFNWQLSVARAGVKNFLVIAEDVGAYHAITLRIPKKQVILAPEPTAPSGAHTYNTSGYNKMVSRRPIYIRAVTAAGRGQHDVLYVDVDTVWASDPFLEFTADYDMHIQSDIDNPYVDPWGMLCTGLVFVRANPRIDQLLLDWQVALKRRDEGIGSKVERLLGVNQPIFNRVVRDAQKSTGLTVKVLDIRKFPSGSIAFGHPKWLSRQMYSPVIFHINYLLGAAKKRAMLVKNGLWYV